MASQAGVEGTRAGIEDPRRGRPGLFLSVFAALLAILAVSNFTKPLQNLRDPTKGLVLLGYRVETLAGNAILGPIFGLILASYAYGLARMRRWALPLGIVYAFWVPANMVLFWFLHAGPRPTLGFILVYLAVALTGSVGTALYLAYHRERLV